VSILAANSPTWENGLVSTKRRQNVLVLRCDECEKRVGRSGYIKIDRQAVAKCFEQVGDIEVLNIDSGDNGENQRVYWQILHADCDTDPKPTDFHLAGHMFSTTGDLLEATAFLLRSQPELMVASNWHGLIGRILADTREYADFLKNPQRAEKSSEHYRSIDALL
jgi:hypothetical protein